MTPSRTLASLALVVCLSACGSLAAPRAGEPCLTPGAWHIVAAERPRYANARETLDLLARHDVVLLGEDHDNADHHRWQLQTLAALLAAGPRLIIGFEAFPRRAQPVLDRWIAGELAAEDLLEQVEWQKVWNFPAELYMPLFEFARLNRIPMVALNVDRALTAEVRAKGWDAVADERKEGLTRPAAASAPYLDYLFEVYRRHAPQSGAAARRSDEAFRRFVEAQTTWDRAFAEGLAAHVRRGEGERPLVVGVMGSGHVRRGHGTVHQLRDLGVDRVATALPVDAGSDCRRFESGYADAVFAVPRSAPASK